MDGVNGIEPFIYPAQPHVRKHAPSGYSDYGEYKDWLRDEFDFRCVYCLSREVWGLRQGVWAVEHLIPRKERLDLETCYTNLVLACGRCNSVKGTDSVPDPCEKAYGKLVAINPDGVMSALDKDGRKLIRAIRLDDEESTEWRRKLIAVIRNLRLHDPKEIPSWLGFPFDLPDLTKRNPKGNDKPEGVLNCRFLQKKSSTLPEHY